MNKYKVTIPPPSAKRMANYAKLIVHYNMGIDPYGPDVQYRHPIQDIYDLEPKTTEFYFEVPEKFEWVHSNLVVNGWDFTVELKYSNSTGTREEKKSLVPEKII